MFTWFRNSEYWFVLIFGWY